jgi:hypothetical protein
MVLVDEEPLVITDVDVLALELEVGIELEEELVGLGKVV